MNFNFSLLLSNKLINIGVVAWVVAQCLKTLIDLLKHKRFDKRRLSGAGGMPSSHSAVTCSILVGSYYLYGFNSPTFALAFILTLIVIYDAASIRWAAGLHAKAINQLVEYLDEKNTENEVELHNMIPMLNESLGHRVIEVICGGILGFAIAKVLLIFF